MLIVGYLIVILLVPTVSAFAGMISMIPFLLMQDLFKSLSFTLPKITVPCLTGIVNGFAMVYLSKFTFDLLGLHFDSTPIWLIFVIYLFNNIARVRRASDRDRFLEIGQLLGEPVGLYWAFNLLV